VCAGRPIAKEGDVRRVAEDPTALPARYLLEDAEGLELLDQLVSGNERDAEAVLHEIHVDEWPLEEEVEKPKPVHAGRLRLNQASVLLPELEDRASGCGGLLRSLGDSAQKEPQPGLPVP